MKNLYRFGLKIEMCPICMKFGTQNKSNMLIVNILRYYATFKVRKFEWLFYKIIYVCKKLPLALDCGQSKYS